jgi:hypothetical protein
MMNSAKVLYDIAVHGFVDAGIVKDMEGLAEYSGKDIPAPIEAKQGLNTPESVFNLK